MKEKMKNILSALSKLWEKTAPVRIGLNKCGEKISTAYKKNPIRSSFITLYIIWPIILFFIIQCMELKSFTKGVRFLFTHPLIFLANVLIIITTLSISLLLKKRIFFVSLISVIWMIFGISNLVLLLNRVTPFTANDLFLIESLFEVIQKYFNTFQIILIGILCLVALFFMILLFFKAPKVSFKMHYINIVVMIAIFFGSTVLLIKTLIGVGIMEGQFAELSAAYRNNGFVYCFTNSLIDTGVNKPKNYSKENIRGIFNDDETVTLNNKTATKTPNIIFVQLETFFNVEELNDVTFSEPVMPNFTAIQKENGGLFSVPVIGAGTVNTEFEVLTGMCMDDFGAGEYPFKSVLKEETTESLATNLKPYGYHAHALHNNTGKFYSRHIVYSNLGFDDFTSVEYMQDYEKTILGWAKDSILTSYIMKCLNSTPEQDLVYTISVQGHGGYTPNGRYDKHLSIKEISPERASTRTQLEYYANMLHEMDMFVGDLVEALSNFDEDCILVMYGDHLPSLEIKASELDNRNVYQTDYIIWSNCGINYGRKNLSADELSAYVMQRLGMKNGVINTYRQNHQSDFDFKANLAALEYDMLYGKKYIFNEKNPYIKTDMIMGLDKISIHNIIPDGTKENTYLIIGQNFTTYSKVYVNDDQKSTKYIDHETLQVTLDDPLEFDDLITVWQSHLTCTAPYKYNVIPFNLLEPETADD